MRVRNAHRRTIGSPEQLGALLDALASDEDRLPSTPAAELSGY